MKCLICGEYNFRLKLSVDDLRYKTTNRIFNVKKCTNCGIYTTFENDEVVDGGKYYPDEYQPFKNPNKIIKPYINTHAFNLPYVVCGRLAWTKLISIKQNMKILDIGCGTGSMGVYLKENFACEVIGIEPSSAAAEKARESGLKVHVGHLEDFDINERFDIVSLIHVIEHLPDPLSDLHKIYDILKPGGKIVIACPNTSSFERMLFRKYWDGWDIPRHINHFNAKSIKYILKKAGFENIEIYYERYSVFFRSVANLLFKNIPYPERKSKVTMPGVGRLEIFWGLLLAIIKSSGAIQVIATRTC